MKGGGIMPSSSVFVQRDPTGIPRRVQRLIDLHPEPWRVWLECCDMVEATDELLAEDFGLFYSLMRELEALGFSFDPSFVAAVEALAMTGRWGEDDSDADPSDEWIDFDDPRESFQQGDDGEDAVIVQRR